MTNVPIKKTPKDPSEKRVIIDGNLKIDDYPDCYSRINVPIFPQNIIDKINVDFSDDVNFF